MPPEIWGGRIVKALIKKGASIQAIVRSDTKNAKIEILKNHNVQLIEAGYRDPQVLVNACKGVNCVISALAGLHDIIVNSQIALLDAALEANVCRFIPSDFSTDFTNCLNRKPKFRSATGVYA